MSPSITQGHILMNIIIHGCGGLERTTVSIFRVFLLSNLEGVVVLKELIFNSFYFGLMWWS